MPLLHALLLLATPCAGQPNTATRIISVEAPGGGVSHPEYALDGDPGTAFSFAWGNGGAALLLDLGGPMLLTEVRVTTAETDRLVWLREVSVGADEEHLRPLLGRPVNLPMRRGADVLSVPLPEAVGRFAKVEFVGGGERGAIAEVELVGTDNAPERHLMCWATDIQRDFLEKLDYLEKDLCATDLWLDYVETAFPQTNHNSGFQPWLDAGAFEEFRKRGVRYWLSEHEAFTHLVNRPEDLRDERKWQTTLGQMRRIYARAKELGFRGIVYDAEDYGGVSAEAEERYADVADHVDAWCFADEFGLGGMYYHRGRQVGEVIAEAHGGPLLQVYEARMYAGKGDCRAGNTWWLKGIHDAGVEVWIATEKTYGAGEGEIEHEGPDHVRRWFVDPAEHVVDAHEAYPFATRILPGFHPWNTRLGKPNYLPKYLAEQLSVAEGCASGHWIYNEGNARAGDPREVLDGEFCKGAGVSAEEYLEVLRDHSAKR